MQVAIKAETKKKLDTEIKKKVDPVAKQVVGFDKVLKDFTLQQKEFNDFKASFTQVNTLVQKIQSD